MDKSARIKKIEIVWPILTQRDLPDLEHLGNFDFLEIWMNPKVYLNSLGVREWVKWIQPAAEDRDLSILIYQCSDAFIHLANYIFDLIPKNCEVMSFYLPFYSEATDETKKVLLTRGHEFIDDNVSLPQIYDSLGNVMMIDVDTNRYFKFLKASSSR